MSSPTCLNCQASLDVQDRFCRNCAQKADTHRLTLSHIFHDFVHAFTHADKGIFKLIGDLVKQPGTVAKEYIAGKRKKYFNPFTFFLIMAGIMVLSSTYFAKPDKPFVPDQQMLSRIPTVDGKQQYITMSERGLQMGQFTRKHGNVLAMCAVPLFALFSWAAFRRNRYNYAEHLTANMMFVTVANLAFTIIVYPLQAMGEVSAVLRTGTTGIGLILQILYFTYAYYEFQMPGARFRLVRAAIVSLSAVLVWILVSMLGMAIFMYRNWHFYEFFTRMFDRR
ncbi:MAG: DUF3667 domain-containing protein [Chitinophagaceae bacterium]|nr:MAG: DUF3667 domain-containing protein [Chitinophagaceae bacterium]